MSDYVTTVDAAETIGIVLPEQRRPLTDAPDVMPFLGATALSVDRGSRWGQIDSGLYVGAEALQTAYEREVRAWTDLLRTDPYRAAAEVDSLRNIPDDEKIRLLAIAAEKIGDLVTDPLTGLSTRGHFYARLRNLYSKTDETASIRSNLPSKVDLIIDPSQEIKLFEQEYETDVASNGCLALFIDLERFKDINDSYDHSVGDKFLERFALKMKSAQAYVERSFPGASIETARRSGDEFLIFVKGVSARQAQEITQVLYDAFRQIQVTFDWSKGGQVSQVSESMNSHIMGAYSHAADFQTACDLIDAADKKSSEVKAVEFTIEAAMLIATLYSRHPEVAKHLRIFGRLPDWVQDIVRGATAD